MLSGFQRTVIGAFDLLPSQQRRLARAIQRYSATSDDERPNFVEPYRRIGKPLVAWVLLRLGIDNPNLIVIGPFVAAILYVAVFIKLLLKLVA